MSQAPSGRRPRNRRFKIVPAVGRSSAELVVDGYASSADIWAHGLGTGTLSQQGRRRHPAWRGLLPAELLDTPYAVEPLRAAGAQIGSGSVVVADDRACIVDLARILTRFCAGEACGKTIPCRIGTRRLVEIADRIVDGRPRPSDPTLLEDLSARHRRVRSVRPRAADDPPAGQWDAIL